MKFIVENSGPGPAFDLRLTVDPDFQMDQGELLSKMGIFKHGIRYMAPGHRIEFYLTSLMGQVEEIAKPDTRFRFTVTATFRSSLGEITHQSYPIDFLHLIGLSSLGSQPLQSIARDIEKLSSTFEMIRSNFSRANVNVYTHEDRQREVQERNALRAQVQAQHSPPQHARPGSANAKS